MLDFEYSLEDELAVRGAQREQKGEARGELKGKISVYFTEMNLTIQQIAEKLGIGEKDVKATLDELQLA